MRGKYYLKRVTPNDSDTLFSSSNYDVVKNEFDNYEEFTRNENVSLELEYFDGDEWETIESKPIVSHKSDEELLSDVDLYFKKKYGSYKYNDVDVFDEHGEYFGCINLRISDHTENIYNVDKYAKCDYYLSVVISDQDPTEDRFSQINALERRKNEIHIKFNSDDGLDDIISKINLTIDGLSNRLIKKRDG
jgi:hypothetical protein